MKKRTRALSIIGSVCAVMLLTLCILTACGTKSPPAPRGTFTFVELGDSVNYVYAPMDWANISNLMLGNCQQIVKIFHILSDENNYPVFYHCRIGTDRTGMLSILINGLLGVKEEDLYRDHLFSNFGYIESQRVIDSGDENSVKNYVDFIKTYPGGSLADKVYNCLMLMGVPASELDSVI